MKNLKQIIAVIAFTIFLLPANTFGQGTSQSSNLDYDVSLMVKVKIHIDVTWGRVSRGCRGFGICDMDFDIVISKIDNNEGSSVVELEKSKNNKFLLTIPYKSINKELRETQFSNQRLIIGEDVFLKDKALLELGFRKETYIIKKGEYKLRETKNGYVVEL